MTDNRILEWFFRHAHQTDVQPITTDKFLDRSKDQYNAAWLCRELIQNWVDHNPQAGTLDGVEFTERKLPGDVVQFKIVGHWPFKDPTGVLSPHSDKPEGRESAGGNGIGLKQAAIRLLRDFNVSKFSVDGEQWSVDYRMVQAATVNARIDAAYAAVDRIVPHHVRHDWLVGELDKTENTGQCAYTIVTKDPRLIVALRGLKELGVSKDNPYLQEPDFANEHGAIKWMPYGLERDGSNYPKGRMFLNGQIFNYKENGPTEQDYWRGPELVSLQMNNVKYAMNIDRPPLDAYKLSTGLDELVGSMTTDQIIDQLRRSEHLWSRLNEAGGYGADRLGCNVVIDKLVKQLRWMDYDKSVLTAYFDGKQYLADDIKSSEGKALREQGYVLCSTYFAEIGMTKASTRLNALDAAVREVPNAFMVQLGHERLAEERGFQASFEDITIPKPEELFMLLRNRLADKLTGWEELPERSGTFRLTLQAEWSKAVLTHALAAATKPDLQLLRFVRGVAHYGLDNNVFVDGRVFISQGEYVNTFSLQPDSVTDEKALYGKITKSAQAGGVFLEFTLPPELADQCRAALSDKELGATPAAVAKPVDEKPAAGYSRQSISPERLEVRYFTLLTQDGVCLLEILP